ncbi:MAG: sigma 54-interacting transcriptional regulator [Candidatus Krumholzibacteria bacterium]|nr:sigma 54-interacting transcriptional regulator [Candidatus Krumholzibacteria bacterium]
MAVSQAMNQVLQACDHFASCEDPVLVTGETGTGKELICRRLHLMSRRFRSPFVAVNCAAIPSDLFERKFFGHNRGAFTGATEPARGFVEQARGGTLFLDEIGDLPPVLQPKLLRLLDDGGYYRLGDPMPRQADVRIVAATNADLNDLIRNGRFRLDLKFRLMGLDIHIPPICRRRQDIVPLLVLFLQRILARPVDIREFLNQEEVETVCRHRWPGNARELLVLARKLRWRSVLPFIEMEIENILSIRDPETLQRLKLSRSELQRQLAVNGGNKAKLAKKLGVARSTVYRWLTD